MKELELPDLALRSLGGAVLWANDESFATRENLITPGPPRFDPELFGPKGKVYDGWETRRRREPGHDEAVIRLGAPGLVRAVVVDTTWFTGNHPPEVSVHGRHLEGLPTVEDLLEPDDWIELVPRSPVAGDTANAFLVTGEAAELRCTHVRVRLHPDGGVARLRVHGLALPDPDELAALGTWDLAAAEYGGRVLACSDRFYGTPDNLLLPGPARHMGEGWETRRRRDSGNDWVEVGLAGQGSVRLVELDTSWFVHNAPGWASLRGRTGDGEEWVELLGRTELRPDTRHRFPIRAAAGAGFGSPPISQVRLDVFPDGGMARMRLFGGLTPDGQRDLERRRRSATAF